MMKRGVIFVSILMLANLVSAVSMEVCLHITKEEITDTCVELYDDNPKLYDGGLDKFYTAKVFSLKDELLNEFDFGKVFFEYSDPGGTFDVEEYDETISFPYYSNVGRLEVWEGEKMMLEVDLSSYVTCNQDGFCDDFESEINCPEDCKVAEPEVTSEEEGVPEEVPSSVVEKVGMARNNGALLLLAILGAFIAVLVIGIMIKRRRR